MKAVFNNDEGYTLNVRETPEGEVIDTFPTGTEFEIEEIEGEWAHVSEPIGGWLMVQYVDVYPEETDDTEEIEADFGHELHHMTVPELKELAKESGIDIPNGTKKEDIINAILHA